MSELIIRKGEEKDLGALHALILELAKYEKCPGEVETGIEDMRELGFGINPVFGFFVAQLHNKVVGIALYYYKYSTWKGRCLYLEDLIVTEKYRRQGIGARLFEAVVALARQEKVKRLEWQVLNWNEPALRFYRRYKADVNDEWLNCRLTYGQLQGE